MCSINTLRRGASVALAVLATGVAGTALCAADDYPNKPIKMIVPFAPGGGTTAMARAVSEPLGARIGQPVVIENRDGAGGTPAPA